MQGVPSGVHLQSAAGLGDAHGQVVQYRKGDDMVTGWLDVEQGRFTALPYTVQSWNYLVALSPTHLVWYYDGTLHVASRQDPAAAVRTVRVGEISQVLGLVGDHVIVSRYNSSLGQNDTYRAVSRVEAVPLDGSAPRTLLARTSRQAVPTPDGGLLVAGGADTDHWGVSLVEAAEDGGVTVRRIANAYPRQAAHTVSQLTLAQGWLTTVETDPWATGRISTPVRPAWPTPPRRGHAPPAAVSCWRTTREAAHVSSTPATAGRSSPATARAPPSSPSSWGRPGRCPAPGSTASAATRPRPPRAAVSPP